MRAGAVLLCFGFAALRVVLGTVADEGLQDLDDAIQDLNALGARFDFRQDDLAKREAGFRVALTTGTESAETELYKQLETLADRTPTVTALFTLMREANKGTAGLVTSLIWKAWLWHKDAELKAKMQAAEDSLGDSDKSPQTLKELNDLVAADKDWAEAWNKRATRRYPRGSQVGTASFRSS
eukprot:TRINITY_DN7522_c0_g1_i2.p1 TRINITY_DN7522_c0_g1~~TRINITY_DN7522_c0_g1_i2.p1  ORF type:complete len:182 (-),score=42.81 TRINITY_DN7522_c0_g1_i2:431-976(-)